MAIGIGALAKLSIGLLPAAVAVLMLTHKELRQHFRNPHLWLSLLVLLLCMSPMLIWNYQHDWVMFRHESRRALETAYSLSSFGTFILGQVFALSPIIAISAIVSLYHRPATPTRYLVWGASTVLLAFFMVKAFSAKTRSSRSWGSS